MVTMKRMMTMMAPIPLMKTAALREDLTMIPHLRRVWTMIPTAPMALMTTEAPGRS